MEEKLLDFWKAAGSSIRILPKDEKEKMWAAIREKYLRPGARIGFSICDALNYPFVSSIRGPEPWRCIADLVKNDTVILFFNKDWGDNFYEIENGSLYVRFYDLECGGIEFYITDAAASFLLAYNESQCLVAMGTAREWLEGYKASHLE